MDDEIWYDFSGCRVTCRHFFGGRKKMIKMRMKIMIKMMNLDDFTDLVWHFKYCRLQVTEISSTFKAPPLTDP